MTRITPCRIATWIAGSAVFAALWTSSALGESAPASLIGHDLSAWRGGAGTWYVAGDATLDPSDAKRLKGEPGAGVTINGPDGRSAHLISRMEHGDCQLHVEFLVAKGSNSGVYLQGRYEIQILDSYGVENPTYADCGGIYQRWRDRPGLEDSRRGYEGKAPRINASKAPGEWQTFDITFRAPRFDASGRKTEDAKFIKVLHNGQVVQENETVSGPTRAAFFDDEKSLGPLMLQGDHGPVAFRNVQLTPIDADTVESK